MRIVRVDLDGFGRLVKCDFEFSNGFNLIFGLNEAGKSTLQRVIVALLYGFFNQGRVTTADRNTAATFKPWDQTASYAGSLIYTLDDGQTFRVLRTFEDKPETVLFTYPDDSDISEKYKKQSYGRLFFAEKHFGMGKEVFENTSYIRQAELISLENSANAITDTLMRLSAGASTDTTATNAIALLRDTYKDKVGSSRAWTKPLAKTRKHLDKLEGERSQVLEKRRELASRMIELNQAKAQLRKLENKHKELHYLEVLAERKDLERQLKATNEAVKNINVSAKLVAKWKDWADFPVHLRDNVIKLTTRYDTLKKECQETQFQVEDVEEKRQLLEEEIAVIKERITDLAEVKDVQSEALANIRELASQWKLTRQTSQSAQERWQKANSKLDELEQQLAKELTQLRPVVELGHTRLAQLQQQWLNAQTQVAKNTEKLLKPESEWAQVNMTEEQFIELEQQVQHIETAVVPIPQPRKGCSLFSTKRPTQSTPQIPTEVKIYRDLQPIYIDLIKVRTEVEEAKQALAQVEASIYETLGDLNGKTINEDMFTELSQKLEQYSQMETEVKHRKKTSAELQSDLDAAHQKEDEAKQALQTKLTKLGFDVSDLEMAFNTYVTQCEKKAELEREGTELEKLELQLQTFNRTIEEWQQKQQSLKTVEAQLCEILAKADIECPTGTDTFKAALEKFEEGVKNHKRWSEAQQDYESAIAHQDIINRTDTTEESLAELEEKLNKMENERPELSQLQANKPPKIHATQLEQLELEVSAARNNLNELQSFIGQINGNLRHLAEIDEEIGQVRTHIQKLEWYGSILEQAEEELTQATEEFQKQFAPKLEVLMNESIDKITQGRYTNVFIDPKNLAVSMTAPEIGEPVNIDQLSTGTRELVYLMLRVSIARLMSRTGERLPLLLDDPLVQSDRRRQEQTLAFLSHLAEEIQIFLFTKDEWVRNWFEINSKSSSKHKLLLLD